MRLDISNPEHWQAVEDFFRDAEAVSGNRRDRMAFRSCARVSGQLRAAMVEELAEATKAKP